MKSRFAVRIKGFRSATNLSHKNVQIYTSINHAKVSFLLTKWILSMVFARWQTLVLFPFILYFCITEVEYLFICLLALVFFSSVNCLRYSLLFPIGLFFQVSFFLNQDYFMKLIFMELGKSSPSESEIQIYCIPFVQFLAFSMHW